MPLVIRGLGFLMLLAALAQWQNALAADGDLDVVGGFALPIAWGITGYGLIKLREWGRQLTLLSCAATVLFAVISIVVERRIGGGAFAMLVFGINVAFLLLRRSSLAAMEPIGTESRREPQIEGCLAGAAGLIVFGALWYAVLLPITGAIWNWYWSLNGFAKLILFVFAGTYFVGLAWFTLAVPFYVAGYFFSLASQEEPTPVPEQPAIKIREQAQGSTVPLPEWLEEKANDAPTMFRVVMDTLELRYRREHPRVLSYSDWRLFTMVGTIGGCLSLALRLHVDVPQAYRTPLELAMRESLEMGFPESEPLYEDCARFVREALLAIERPKRGVASFVLISTWVFGVISDGESLDGDAELVAELAQVYQNEAGGYWVTEQPF